MKTAIATDPTRMEGKFRFKKYTPILDMFNGVLTPVSLDVVPLSERTIIEETPWMHNLVMAGTNTGLGIITQRLIGLTVYDLEITQGKIGTGTTAPTDGDTDLETTTLSGIIRSTQIATATTATIEFFIPTTELSNGTYTEFGLFCGAQIFARSIITPSYTKSTNEDTGVEYIITAGNT